MRQLNLVRDDLKLIIKALELAASRRESMARAGVGRKRGTLADHSRQAERMRAVRARLVHAITENPGERDFSLEPRP